MANHRSYSQLDSFAHCGEQFRLTRRVKVPEEPSMWTVGGSAFHEVSEWWDRDVSGAKDPTLIRPLDSEIAKRWTQRFDELLGAQEKETGIPASLWRTAGRATKEKPNKEDETWWREAGLGFVIGYIDWRLANWSVFSIAELPDGEPCIESAMMVDYPGGVKVRMFPDRVMTDSNDHLFVLDLKTGSRVPMKPHQLGTYSSGLKLTFDMNVNYGTYFMARKGGIEPMKDIRHFTPELVGKMFETMDFMETSGLYLPHIGDHCNYCGVRKHCVYQGGVPYEPPEPVGE